VIFDADARGTIGNDDVNIRIGDTSASEPDSGLGEATFTVTLSAPVDFPVAVNFATANSTASAPSDYLVTNGTLHFAPGQASQTITTILLNDVRNEIDERFLVNLSRRGHDHRQRPPARHFGERCVCVGRKRRR
jgi:hypothetical protein